MQWAGSGAARSASGRGTIADHARCRRTRRREEETAQISLKIVGHAHVEKADGKDSVAYTIRVRYSDGTSEHTIERRYSHFKSLWKAMG